MARHLILGIAIGASVMGAAWLITASPGQFPGSESDFAGSRSFSDPWKAPDFFSPEKNALPPDVEKILNSGERFMLLSLDPKDLSKEEEQRLGPEALFHGFRVLGKSEIRNEADRAALLRALYAGIADSNGMAAACFNPRHGLSATLDGTTVDVVICFECLQIEAYLNDRPVAINGFAQALTSALSKPLFNRALKKAGLPVAR